MTTDEPTHDPIKPKSGLGGLVSAARDGKAEAPQSELNAAKPASDGHDPAVPHEQPQSLYKPLAKRTVDQSPLTSTILLQAVYGRCMYA
jgi:hypothetical protein